MKSDINEIWKKHKTDLLHFIEKKVNNKQDAEDIFQELMIKLIVYSGQDEIENERAWLFTVARNLVNDHFRHNHFITEELNEIPDSEEVVNTSRDEAREYLFPLLKLLPAEYEVPLRMSELNGMKQADIAKELNIGFSATRTRIHRAKMMLREIVERCTCIEMDAAGKLFSFGRRKCQTEEQYKKQVHIDFHSTNMN